MTVDEAWVAIARIATDHMLISEAFSGYMILLDPTTQRETGNCCRIQRAHGVKDVCGVCKIPLNALPDSEVLS